MTAIHRKMIVKLIMIASALTVGHAAVYDRRPIYSIGHMVNCIKEIEEYLDMGANVLESDIMFFDNGTLNRIYHGPPCDCNRVCNNTVQLPEFLDRLRELTDPKMAKNYYDQLTLMFFDLKLDNVEDKEMAGTELADAVLDHLWAHDDSRDRVRVLVFIYKLGDNGTISGFVNRFKDRRVENLLQYVGFDGGMDGLEDIRSMLEDLGIKKRIWLGDGNINCVSATYPDSRLRELIQARDAPNGYIDKVYHWTIDDEQRIRRSLNLEVDGLITNRPDVLSRILKQQPFASRMRLATTDDDPFARFYSPRIPSGMQDSCMVDD